jgi:folylpolyglutamate synthase
MMEKAAAQLILHGRAEDPRELFDDVVFCTISTHANGIYKKGACLPKPYVLSLNLANVGLWLDSTLVSTPQADGDHLNTPQELAVAWSSLVPDFPTKHIHTLPSIDHAVNLIRGLGSHDSGHQISVLVTGSLYVVGGVIKVAGLTDVAL